MAIFLKLSFDLIRVIEVHDTSGWRGEGDCTRRRGRFRKAWRARSPPSCVPASVDIAYNETSVVRLKGREVIGSMDDCFGGALCPGGKTLVCAPHACMLFLP
jgi:hypothetical protein